MEKISKNTSIKYSQGWIGLGAKGWRCEWWTMGAHFVGVGKTKEEARKNAVEQSGAETPGKEVEACAWCETAQGIEVIMGPWGESIACERCAAEYYRRGVSPPSIQISLPDDTHSRSIGLPPLTFEDAIARIQSEMLDIMLSKRALRGTENITRQGIYGVATRMAEDKLARIQKAVDKLYAVHLLEKIGMGDLAETVADRMMAQGTVEDSLEDDLLDTANYSIICLLLQRGWWELPTRKEIGRELPWGHPTPRIPMDTHETGPPWEMRPISDGKVIAGWEWECACSAPMRFAVSGDVCRCGAVVPTILDLDAFYEGWASSYSELEEGAWCPVWVTGETDGRT